MKPSPLKGRKKIRWSVEEIKILETLCDGTRRSVCAAAVRMGRTKNSALNKAHRLGLIQGKGVKIWTKSEDLKLGELIYMHSPWRVSRLMKRSESAVLGRVKRLGLKPKLYRTGWFTQVEVAQIFGRSEDWVRFRISRGMIEAENGVHNANPVRVSSKALRKFIINYPYEISKDGLDMVVLVEIILGKERPI